MPRINSNSLRNKGPRKLTDSEKLKMQILASMGKTQEEIAQIVGVTQSIVSRNTVELQKIKADIYRDSKNRLETTSNGTIINIVKRSLISSRRASRLYGYKECITSIGSIVREYNGNCKICCGEKKLTVDHCHKTGKFRGWLCYDCNIAIGHSRESIKILSDVIDYLNGSIVYEKKEFDNVIWKRVGRLLSGCKKTSISRNYMPCITPRNLICSSWIGKCYMTSCNSIDKINLEHCHKTGEFRGWVCHWCNSVIGHSIENVGTLAKMINYLESFS